MTDLDSRGLEAAAKAIDVRLIPNETRLHDMPRVAAEACVRAYLAASLPPDGENPYPLEWPKEQCDHAHIAWRDGFAASRAAASPDPRVPSGLPIGYGGPTVKVDPVALLARIKAIVDEPLDERVGYGPTRTDQFTRIDTLLRDVRLAAASPDERLREALRVNALLSEQLEEARRWHLTAVNEKRAAQADAERLFTALDGYIMARITGTDLRDYDDLAERAARAHRALATDVPGKLDRTVLDPETGIEEPVTTGRIPDAEFVEPPLMPPAASPDERLREALELIRAHARLDLTERGIAEAERYAVIADDALTGSDLLASSTAEKLASPRKHSASASDPMPLCDCEFCARPLRDHEEETR